MLGLINKYLVTTTAIITLMQVSVAYDSLDYQKRGDRWEGVAFRPVSGLDIELLSALVDHRENGPPIPSQCKLKFYLPSATAVDLRVQELRPKYYYKMDRVIPRPFWHQGFNDYQWPTREIIKPLGLKLNQLGVVARLKKRSDTGTEYVAPVVFYGSTPPTTINGYLFAFKVDDSARLSYAIYHGNSVSPVAEGNLGRQFPGKPFVVRWDSSRAKEGPYELVVDGYFLNNYMLTYQAVQFYHKPLIVK